MPGYGSTSGVKDLLSSQPNQAFEMPQEARMTQLLAVVSTLIEHQTGAVFGTDAPETVVVDADGGRYLWLPKGARSVAGITEAPDWVNGAWTGGTALTTSAWRLDGEVQGGAYRRIVRMDGGWHGDYLVTGVWEDAVADVPEEIHYLANYLSAEIFKKQPMSPAGFVGPDGVAVSLRDAFRETEVKMILDKYRVGPGMWVV